MIGNKYLKSLFEYPDELRLQYTSPAPFRAKNVFLI